MFRCNLVQRDVFSDVSGEWDRLIDRVSPSHFDVNMETHDDTIVVTADLPGVRIEDLSVTVKNDVLAIAGDRGKVENEELHLCERATGKFYRSFKVPADVDQLAVAASLKNGVLTLTLPRKVEAQPRKIEIQVSS